MFSPRLCTILLAVTMLASGCYNRGRQEVSGVLTVENSGRLILRDRDGTSVEFASGATLLDYQDRGFSRGTSLFVIRSASNRSHGVLLEVPTSAFSADASFRISAGDCNQAYDLNGNRSTEHLGSHEYQDTEGCTAPGVCCQLSFRTRTDSDGHSHTESYTDCGFHVDCPGRRDVLKRQDDYIDHYRVEFTPQSRVDAAHFRGDGPPYSTHTKIRNLSGCRN